MKPITIDDIKHLYWFDKYVANIERVGYDLEKYVGGARAKTIQALIYSSFVFSSSPEGSEYWRQACKTESTKDSLAKIIDDL